MKLLPLLMMLLFFFDSTAQKTVAGTYHDFFGGQLDLKADSTFEYKWNFDLASSWSVGKWSMKKNTLYLDVIPVLDTLRCYDDMRNITVDTLVLSDNRSSELITNEQFGVSSLTGGGQNRQALPERLYYRNRKLFLVSKNGKPSKKRRKAILSRKMLPQYFIKE